MFCCGCPVFGECHLGNLGFSSHTLAELSGLDGVMFNCMSMLCFFVVGFVTLRQIFLF